MATHEAFNDGPHKGTTPVEYYYCQNFDFSSFPILCRETYTDMSIVDSEFCKNVPFCAFLHVCTTALNAKLLYMERRPCTSLLCFEVYEMPQPITEYISNVNDTITNGGITVHVNIPAAAIPRGGDKDTAGSFGKVTAENHNLYECYVSPNVTRRRIEASLSGCKNWTPLSPNLLPECCEATPNFLGYGPIDKLSEDQRTFLSGLEFPSGDNTELCRIQYCSELMEKVVYWFRHMSPKYKMELNWLNYKTTSDFVGFLEVADSVDSSVCLANIRGILWSPIVLNSSLSNKAYILGLKRKRNDGAPGMCLLRNENPIEGWMEHINDNFNCMGIFAIKKGVDVPFLRTTFHYSILPKGLRSNDLLKFIFRMRGKNYSPLSHYIF